MKVLEVLSLILTTAKKYFLHIRELKFKEVRKQGEKFIKNLPTVASIDSSMSGNG
jgi:hypothetical protein